MIGTLGTYFPEHCNQNPLWTKNNPKITLGTLVTQRIHVKIMGQTIFYRPNFLLFGSKRTHFSNPDVNRQAGKNYDTFDLMQRLKVVNPRLNYW